MKIMTGKNHGERTWAEPSRPHILPSWAILDHLTWMRFGILAMTYFVVNFVWHRNCFRNVLTFSMATNLLKPPRPEDMCLDAKASGKFVTMELCLNAKVLNWVTVKLSERPCCGLSLTEKLCLNALYVSSLSLTMELCLNAVVLD